MEAAAGLRKWICLAKMVASMWPAALMPNPCPEGAGLSISSRKRGSAIGN